MADEKKEEVKAAPEAAPAAAAPAETPAAAGAPTEVKAEAKKEEAKPKKEKPTTCAACGKSIKKKCWYYRNGKYFCTKRCWKTTAKKEEAPKEPEAKPQA